MIQQQSSKPFLYLRCSSLSHVDFCPIRSKAETFSKMARTVRPDGSKNHAMITGTKMHAEKSFGLYDWERDHIVYGLMPKEHTYTRYLETPNLDIFVRGAYDDLRVIRYHDEKYISFIEMKTTFKKYMWEREIKAAVRQLQLYMWMFKEEVESLGYKLWKRSYVEIYSQKTGLLMKRVPVYYDEHIEDWVINCVEMFQGLAPMIIAPYAYCRICPIQVKKNCSYYAVRSNDG